tara:strand:- start:21 stop:464 length:444 start_codon:yes stop_codon:yes gene_type:complete
MTTRSSGFTLIELVVVVAIIGILAAVAITAYSNYISNAKIKNAENTLLQLSLAQTEFFTDNRIYKVDVDVNCPATSDTSGQLSTDLVGDDIITETNADGDDIHDFDYCADANGANGFVIEAEATTASNLDCILTINETGVVNRSDCP